MTIPKELADKYDVIAVRKAVKGEMVEAGGKAISAETALVNDASVYAILRPRPTWIPPASLAQGLYQWNSGGLYRTGKGPTSLFICSREDARKIFRDWEDPSCFGQWKVHISSTATFVGE